MSRSTERLLPKFFGLYTTKLGHRKRHIDSFRFSSLCKRQNTVPEGKVRRDPFLFHSSSEKTYGRWGIAGRTLKGPPGPTEMSPTLANEIEEFWYRSLSKSTGPVVCTHGPD